MSPKFSDSLRGYAHAVLKRDRFTCRYCGLDGTIWPNWLYLSWDHLLPKGNPKRDDPDFIVAACLFCNTAANRTVWDVSGKTPDELVAQKKPVVLAVRERYREFWEKEVVPNEGADERFGIVTADVSAPPTRAT
ncbi:MAG: hypothetical protein QOF33_493 [Thermomicrobiales bacterium]|nr:hypothetical protein [Thermomicrobiales bacterium]